MSWEKLDEELAQQEAYLEAALNNCRKARKELGRVYAPTPLKGRKKSYNSSIAKVIGNRNKTILNRRS